MLLHPQSPLLNHCPETLPRSAYVDAAWYARERRDDLGAPMGPCSVARTTCRAGTMRRVSVAGENLILCRDAAGKITAFHNTCRHRGSELCAEAEKPMGKLITLPLSRLGLCDRRPAGFDRPCHADRGFRKADHGLHPVHVQAWNGFLFSASPPTPPDFRPDLGLHALDNWPMDELVTGHRWETVLACNWKVFWENYNECLHCPGIHPELCDMVPIYRAGHHVGATKRPAGRPDAAPAPALKRGALTLDHRRRSPAGRSFPT